MVVELAVDAGGVGPLRSGLMRARLLWPRRSTPASHSSRCPLGSAQQRAANCASCVARLTRHNSSGERDRPRPPWKPCPELHRRPEHRSNVAAAGSMRASGAGADAARAAALRNSSSRVQRTVLVVLLTLMVAGCGIAQVGLRRAPGQRHLVLPAAWSAAAALR